jgi:hypothetical protein
MVDDRCNKVHFGHRNAPPKNKQESLGYGGQFVWYLITMVFGTFVFLIDDGPVEFI